MKKIGITINIINTLFSSGHNQNGIYLGHVLKSAGYDVDLICANKKTLDEVLNYEKDLRVIEIGESYDVRYDVLIQVGFTISTSQSSRWLIKNDNIKFVAYECGNHYLVNTEKMLFNYGIDTSHFRNRHELDQRPHQVWSIPQMENTNYTFYQFHTRQDNVTVVPFIWEPFVIERSFDLRGKGTYTPRPIERCSVMEPNMSVMKNAILPVVILEKNQKQNPLKNVYLFGTDKIKTSKPFVDFVASTELFKKKIVSAESRYTTAKVLPDHTDFVFSWQWENNLNYLWLDVAWMGWPIVHNGSLCQDVGYYYEGFDGDVAVEKIGEVIKTHNNNYEEYLKLNREIIKRYTKENEVLVNQYKELIENLLQDRFERKKYDWKTNKIY